MRIGNLQLILIFSVAAAFIVSTIAKNRTYKSAFDLAPDLRDRIWKREASTFNWWRIPESLGIAALVLGILKMYGMIPAPGQWGIPTMTLGFATICMATSVGAWLSNKAYSAEAPGTSASRSAFQAAVLVTVCELALGGFVCWFVLMPRLTPANSTPRNSPGASVQTSKRAPADPRESTDTLWVDETEALRLLKGKDLAYLKALVAREDIRSRDVDGKIEYRRDDISQTKLAGLPTMEELNDSLEQRKKEPPREEKPKIEEKPKVEKQDLKE